MIKRKYDLTKPVRYIVMFGIAALGCMLIGDAIAGVYFDATHPVMRTPVPEKYVFKAQIPTMTPSPSPTPLKEHTEPVSWEQYKVIAQTIAKREDYPISVLLGQAALESARGRSSFALDRFNYHGICAYDSDPNKACRYESVEAGIMGYIKLIRDNPRYAKAWKNRKSPRTMIAEIKAAGYATDPNYVSKVTGMPEFRDFE